MDYLVALRSSCKRRGIAAPVMIFQRKVALKLSYYNEIEVIALSLELKTLHKHFFFQLKFGLSPSKSPDFLVM